MFPSAIFFKLIAVSTKSGAVMHRVLPPLAYRSYGRPLSWRFKRDYDIRRLVSATFSATQREDPTARLHPTSCVAVGSVNSRRRTHSPRRLRAIPVQWLPVADHDRPTRPTYLTVPRRLAASSSPRDQFWQPPGFDCQCTTAPIDRT